MPESFQVQHPDTAVIEPQQPLLLQQLQAWLARWHEAPDKYPISSCEIWTIVSNNGKVIEDRRDYS